MVDDIKELEIIPAQTEVVKPEVMLRLQDGTPVTIEFRQDHQWEMDPRTGVRKQGVAESFNPKFEMTPNIKDLVKIEVGNDKRYFEIVTPLPGQEVKKGPSSIYANQIDVARFNELSQEPDRKVVVPTNLPQDIG